MIKLWGVLWRGTLVLVLTILSFNLVSFCLFFMLNHYQMLQHYDTIYSPFLWICRQTRSYNVDVMIFGSLWIVLIVLSLGSIALFYAMGIGRHCWHKGVLFGSVFLLLIKVWVGSFFNSFWLPGGMTVLQAVVEEVARESLEQIQEGIETEQPPCDAKAEEPAAEVITEDKNVP